MKGETEEGDILPLEIQLFHQRDRPTAGNGIGSPLNVDGTTTRDVQILANVLRPQIGHSGAAIHIQKRTWKIKRAGDRGTRTAGYRSGHGRCAFLPESQT